MRRSRSNHDVQSTLLNLATSNDGLTSASSSSASQQHESPSDLESVLPGLRRFRQQQELQRKKEQEHRIRTSQRRKASLDDNDIPRQLRDNTNVWSNETNIATVQKSPYDENENSNDATDGRYNDKHRHSNNIASDTKSNMPQPNIVHSSSDPTTGRSGSDDDDDENDRRSGGDHHVAHVAHISCRDGTERSDSPGVSGYSEHVTKNARILPDNDPHLWKNLSVVIDTTGADGAEHQQRRSVASATRNNDRQGKKSTKRGDTSKMPPNGNKNRHNREEQTDVQEKAHNTTRAKTDADHNHLAQPRKDSFHIPRSSSLRDIIVAASKNPTAYGGSTGKHKHSNSNPNLHDGYNRNNKLNQNQKVNLNVNVNVSDKHNKSDKAPNLHVESTDVSAESTAMHSPRSDTANDTRKRDSTAFSKAESDDEEDERPLHMWEIICLCIPATAVQIGWCIGEALVIPYLLELGISPTFANLIFLINPVVGVFLQPAIGRWSDSSTFKYGKRTLFLFALHLFAAAGMLVST
jgi:hypothetical protein